jgi:Hydroxypyruvate isomerase
MPKFAANLSLMFSEEESLLDRFAAARESGFSAVEYMFPYEEEADDIRARLDDNDLDQVLFNLPAGDWSAGDRGTACDPDRVDEFRDGVEQAREYARVLDCPRLNCLAGLRLDERSYDEQWDVLVENVRHAAQALGEDGRTLLVEPVNSYDVEGFFVPYTADVMRLLDEVDADNRALPVRLLPRAEDGGEPLRALRRTARADRSRAGRGQPRSPSAGHRGDRLRLRVRAHRRLRIRGLGGPRVRARR